MDDWFDRDLFTIAWLTLMAMLIASSWPRRRTRPFVLSLFIAAPRETVWSAYHTDLEDPISTAFHKTTVAMRRVSDDPPIDEFAFDASGHGSHFSTVQYQRIEERHPELSIARNCSINGKPYPYGREQLETLRLEEQADGTLATYEFHGETGTIWPSFPHVHPPVSSLRSSATMVMFLRASGPLRRAMICVGSRWGQT